MLWMKRADLIGACFFLVLFPVIILLRNELKKERTATLSPLSKVSVIMVYLLHIPSLGIIHF